MATLFTGIQPTYTTGQKAPAATAYGPTKYSTSYGGIPSLPAYTVDTTQQIGTDVPGQLAANLPLYGQMTVQASQDILSNLAGEVPQDVIRQISQQAAERGIAGGIAGSPNANAAMLRALGLTSTQLQQLGQQELTAAIQRTPIQQTQLGTNVQDLAAQQAVYAAAPAPGAAAGAAMAAAQRGVGQGMGSVAMPQMPTTPRLTDTASTMAGTAPAMQGSYGGTGFTDYSQYGWQPYGGGWINPDTGQTYGSMAQPTGSQSYIGAGKWGTPQQAFSEGSYTDPLTGQVWSQEVDGTWSNAQGETSTMPPNMEFGFAGGEGTPIYPGSSPMGAGGSYFGTPEEYAGQQVAADEQYYWDAIMGGE